MKEVKLRTVEEIAKLNRGEAVVALWELTEAYRKIQDIKDHLEIATNSAYGHQLDMQEHGERSDNPYELIDPLLKTIKESYKETLKLRNHTHQWEDIYGDGRDLSCQCQICGIMET